MVTTKNINTSRAQYVNASIFNYDQLPVSLEYTNEADPQNPVPLDLTDYRFDFYLKDISDVTRLEYSIAAGVLTNDYLQKTGDDTNILNLQNMLEDLRAKSDPATAYRLIQIATNPQAQVYAQIIYQINVGQY